jgi:thiol-disulfide isomerase/thioredoxin
MIKNKSIIFLLFFFLTIGTFAQKKANMEGIEIGIQAPPINLPTVLGENFDLDQVKGKIVFVNFWASWCAPCRKKSPDLVEIYRDYKDKEFENGEQGFEMVFVSLDKNEELWKRNIEKDGIGELINVGDMKGWRCAAAQTYSIKRIPSSVMLDGEGRIIALNPNTKELKKKLKNLKKKNFFGF